METVTAPCSHCFIETHQNVLHSARLDLDEYGENVEIYKLLQCAGCRSISMAKDCYYFEDFQVRYYPPPAKRKMPSWQFLPEVLPHKSAVLLDEIYEAMRGGQYRLAVMGIRALLEQLMISKVGDHGSFKENVNAFCDKGYISNVKQRDQLNDILEAGHATMHRNFNPTERDVSIALDITENILSTINVNGEATASVADRIPPRPPRTKSS